MGHGYVGLVSAAVFADLGSTVYVIGHTEQKIEQLKKGIIPIFEPGLAELVKRNIAAKRLFFSLEYDPFVASSDIVFIAVGTPSKKKGEADLTTVFKVSEQIGKHLSGYTVVATKSTVPVGVNRKIKKIIEKAASGKAEFDVASVPEFLREGSAIADTLSPDRIVIGTENKRAEDLLVDLHKPINSTFVLTNLETAEMIKYASNSFLAMKISYANAIAKLSELASADGTAVLEAVGLDKRIGREFLRAGVGYGGSCFPKDVKAFISIAGELGYDFKLMKATEEINRQARYEIVHKAEMLAGGLRGKLVGILGLSFKPDTDDMRDAPSVDIIEAVNKKGGKVKVYDPQAMSNAKKILSSVTFCQNAYEVAEGADILVIVTDWNEFKEIDFGKLKKRMRQPIVIDGRNIYNPERLSSLGFVYQGVGRSTIHV